MIIHFTSLMCLTAHKHDQQQQLNIVVEWLARLLCLREVPGLNFSPETGYPEVFRAFP
jgi:hypothetical protein